MFPGGIGGFGAYNFLGSYGALVPYGTLNLTEASPAQSFTEILTLSEVKAFLVLQESSPADGIDDAILESAFIPAAREVAEFMQGRDLIRKSWDLSLDYWRGWNVELRAPLVSVELVKYRNSSGSFATLTENTDYLVDAAKQPGLIMPMYLKSWPSFTPWPSSAVLVRFTSGYAASHPFWSDAGKRLKIGMLYLISRWYEGRQPFAVGAPQGITEFPFAITQMLSYGAREKVF